MSEAMYHHHSMDNNQKVYGKKLEAGDVLEPTDVYNSTSGKWEPTPCPGAILKKQGPNVVWVRPTKEVNQ